MITKGRGLLCTRAGITCRVIQELQRQAGPVAQACRELRVSRAGYGQHVAQDPAITGLETGRCKARSLMRKDGARPVWKRRFLHTTNRRHDRLATESLLDRRFNPGRPNQAGTSAIPYLRTQAGGRYPAAVIDLDARRIAGRVLAPHLRAGPVAAARQTARRQRQPGPGLRLHADRGSPYAGGADQPLRARHDIMCRMRRKGGCRDHAAMARLFLNLKMERARQQATASPGGAQRDIAAYIAGFYNCVRLHSALGNLPPVAFARLKAVKQPVRVSEIS